MLLDLIATKSFKWPGSSDYFDSAAIKVQVFALLKKANVVIEENGYNIWVPIS